jgi:hypothetical protein
MESLMEKPEKNSSNYGRGQDFYWNHMTAHMLSKKIWGKWSNAWPDTNNIQITAFIPFMEINAFLNLNLYLSLIDYVVSCSVVLKPLTTLDNNYTKVCAIFLSLLPHTCTIHIPFIFICSSCFLTIFNGFIQTPSSLLFYSLLSYV